MVGWEEVMDENDAMVREFLLESCENSDQLDRGLAELQRGPQEHIERFIIKGPDLSRGFFIIRF